jgi:hypothetical protein
MVEKEPECDSNHYIPCASHLGRIANYRHLSHSARRRQQSPDDCDEKGDTQLSHGTFLEIL